MEACVRNFSNQCNKVCSNAIGLFFLFRQATNGDLYFFNFHTGESLWEHPSDKLYRQKVIEERKNSQLSRKLGNEKVFLQKINEMFVFESELMCL